MNQVADSPLAIKYFFQLIRIVLVVLSIGYLDGISLAQSVPNPLWGGVDYSCIAVNRSDLPKSNIAKLYHFITPYTEDLAAVGIIPRGERNAKWGFIDRNGKVVIPIIYDVISPFHGGVAGVGKFPSSRYYPDWWLINKTGKILTFSLYLSVRPLGEGMTAVAYPVVGTYYSRWSLANSQGLLSSIPFLNSYDYIWCFGGGRARACYLSVCGYVDKAGKFSPDKR